MSRFHNGRSVPLHRLRPEQFGGTLVEVSNESPKSEWVSGLPAGESDKRVLGRIIDVDHDEFETAMYEAAADPLFMQREREQRRYRERFRRHLRVFRSRNRD